MKKKGKHCRDPKNTNPTGGRGHGRGGNQGRVTFIDELVARTDSCIGSILQEPRSKRREFCQTLLQLESSSTPVENPLRISVEDSNEKLETQCPPEEQ